MPRQAILLAAPGVSRPEEHSGLDAFGALARAHFAPTAVRWTYTSRILREHLAKRGVVIPGPEDAFAQLKRERVDEVTILALHLFDGTEYQALCEAMHASRTEFSSVRINRPLLDSDPALDQVLATLAAAPRRVQEDEALVVVGHGSLQESAKPHITRATNRCTSRHPQMVLAFLLGRPGAEHVVQHCKRHGLTRAYLIPLFLTAGQSVRALADQSEPFCQTLLDHGITCRTESKGLLEYPEIAETMLGSSPVVRVATGPDRNGAKIRLSVFVIVIMIVIIILYQ